MDIENLFPGFYTANNAIKKTLILYINLNLSVVLFLQDTYPRVEFVGS